MTAGEQRRGATTIDTLASEMARIRVAAVMDTAIVSGPGRQLAAIVGPLRKRGVDIRVVVFQNPTREKTAYRRFLEAAGIDHAVVPYHSRLDRSLLPALRRVLAEWDPHIVQTHSYRPTTLVWLTRLGGVPWRWIGFFHGTTNEDLKVRVYHWLDRHLLLRADRIVVMSRSQVARFAARREKVVQLYNAVIPVSSSPVSAETQAQLARVEALPRPRVGVVGRLSAEKGVDVMVDALSRMAAAGFRGSLVLAGNGPERAALEAHAAQAGLAGAVCFLGRVMQIEPLYPLLDLLVIPSRSEGLPNVLLEALRADVPVVSTRVGAVPEVLEGTRAGWMVTPGDPGALAEAVNTALATPAADGKADRAEVVQRFSLEQRTEAHLRLYHGVLHGASR